MEKYIAITEDIENVTNREVIRQNRISVMALSWLVLSVVLFWGAYAIADPNSSVATFLYTTSVFVFLGSVVKLCLGRKCYLFKPTGSRVKARTIYFDNKERSALENCMETADFTVLEKLKRQINTGVKMEIWVAQDGQFAALQLAEYVPYTYEPSTPVKCYYNENARQLTDFVKKYC